MEYQLWKCTITHPEKWRKRHRPVYAVEETKEKAAEYVNRHLKDGYTVGSVSQLGKQLATFMYHG
jgi:hypothetical protein